MKPIIGILGGIGPESSARFYSQLVSKVQEAGITDNTQYPHIILESIPAPELVHSEDLTQYKDALRNLQEAGADFITIVCNTAYTHLDELQAVIDIPILDLPKAITRTLKSKRTQQVTIIGSQKTSTKLMTEQDIQTKQVDAEDAEKIDRIILRYNTGKHTSNLQEQVEKIIKKYTDTDIIIACTELSVLMADNSEYIDTFDILLQATYDRWDHEQETHES